MHACCGAKRTGCMIKGVKHSGFNCTLVKPEASQFEEQHQEVVDCRGLTHFKQSSQPRKETLYLNLTSRSITFLCCVTLFGDKRLSPTRWRKESISFILSQQKARCCPATSYLRDTFLHFALSRLDMPFPTLPVSMEAPTVPVRLTSCRITMGGSSSETPLLPVR